VNPVVKLGAFAAVLAAVFLAALGVGAAYGPDHAIPPPRHGHLTSTTSAP
jgi:hypothetical protein